LILGGGDVMASAETGSGKTAAFALPVLQLCYEQKTQGNSKSPARKKQKPPSNHQFVMSNIDRDASIAIDPQSQGLRLQSRDAKAWAGCRCDAGVQGEGKYYYEVRLSDDGIVRVGWSSSESSLELGTDKGSYGYGGTGVTVHAGKYDPYPDSKTKTGFGKADVVGCLLELTNDGGGSVSFSKNGALVGKAFDLSRAGGSWFPAVCVKNAECLLNFGATDVQYLPAGFQAIAKAGNNVVPNPLVVMSAQMLMKDARGPMAIVIEPTRDLAEQTFRAFNDLSNRIADPFIRATLLVGGIKPTKTLKLLEKNQVDVLVGTPPIIASYIKKGAIQLQRCNVFVLDEADELISSDNAEHIQAIYSRLAAARGSASRFDRLQVCFFSATLHSKEVKSLAERLCHQPLWVDLRGQNDSIIPDTVHHCVISVDSDQYESDGNDLVTDSVHRGGKLDFDIPWSKLDERDSESERIKQLKPRILTRIMDELSMEQVLVFCRTNLDCDLMEKYLRNAGGGGIRDKYTCRVLAGMRTMEERQKALKDFKAGEVRILICTDVAARGIDIRELPFVVNMTLPDQPGTYVHRIGRVGRAERMGMAISLVGCTNERVWFCPKGKKPPQSDTRLYGEGGNTIWYDEPKLLGEIEELMIENKVSMTRLKWPELKIPAEIKALLDGGGYGNYAGGGTVDPEMEAKMKELESQVKAIGITESALQFEFWKLRDRFRIIKS
jgi:ATP-dependent RNA helicase DDX1